MTSPPVVPDTYLRHHRVALAVQRDIPEGAVLNVGDTSFELSLHLPGRAVTYLDVLRPLRIPRGDEFLREDFTATALADDSYACVVALDVLEHVHPSCRAAFLAHAARVASRKAFIAFPCGADAAAVEALIRRSTRRRFCGALDEHARLGLPAMDEISGLLDDAGITHRWSPLTTVWEWLSSFVVEEDGGDDPAVVEDYSLFLNDRASAEPGPGPYYRYLLELEGC
jgi:hypothetical protein